jgi:hypothetical protein
VIKLLIALGMLGALLVGSDLVVEGIAEDQIAKIAHEQIEDAGPTTADISSFPFVARVALAGEVRRVRVTQREIPVGPLTVASVTVTLDGVQLDRGRLFGDRDVFLTDIDSGSVVATITDDEVSRLLDVPVTFADGIANATVAGVDVAVRASVRDGALVLSPEGAPALSVPLPRIPLVPCVADAAIGDGVVELSCEIDEIPPELLRAAQRAAQRAA